MTSTDAIVIGEGWISEHYFTTDATSQSFQSRINAFRKSQDEEAAAGFSTTRSRFSETRGRLEVEIASLPEMAEDHGASTSACSLITEQLISILGFTRHGFTLARSGPVQSLTDSTVGDQTRLILVSARPADSVEDLLSRDAANLSEPFIPEDGKPIDSVARLLSHFFVQDHAPEFALVFAGRWLLVAERERWAEGRYLALDVLLVCERNDSKRGGEIDRFLACVASESLAPNADGTIAWHSVLEESIKHTVGVSQDLRDGVRLSIEIIANEVVRRRLAAGLSPLDATQAQPLAKQSLRFLYRILFLLFAEASPELGVLPVGAPEYAQGYSLDRLRELVQVELATPQAISGTHMFDSLSVLFQLVDRGHALRKPSTSTDDEQGDADSSIAIEGLVFNPLRADLFHPAATALIDEVGLGNSALQQVLSHLLLSKESRGRDRGFISYAELGINQLGAVYEGLMSYTGFFANTDLLEVARNGDATDGSWVVPVSRAESIDSKDFVRLSDSITGELKPVLHERGSFVFRLAGRERQQSASYYTPEVLTRFTVSQALEELLDQNGTVTPASELLSFKVCEPALGSGAFAIEAARQLASEYLNRRQRELGKRIDPEEFPRRLQETKAYIALHNVYGVDLNATAIELAEISLWLDTMVEGLDAPWFGLHLRRGNSLIGARRSVFSKAQVTDKSFLKAVPHEVPMTKLQADINDGSLATDIDGSIHHFLLPSPGWGSATDAKEAKTLAADELTRLKSWRSSIQSKPTKQQVDALADLAMRVESLWQLATRRLEIAEDEVRRAIPVWGTETASGGTVQREEIERSLADSAGAYQRLRRVMDAWCALWFWPLTDSLTNIEIPDGSKSHATPPTLTQWIDALQLLLGRHAGKARGTGGTAMFDFDVNWGSLGDAESNDLAFAGAMPIDSIITKHPWLITCERIAAQQGFFHWELDFAMVFARGGFDLQVGNPPWVRPDVDVDALLAEGDPWWQLALKPTEPERIAKRAQTLELDGVRELVIDGTAGVAGLAASVGSPQYFPYLDGLRPDLYRCFMEQTWLHASKVGVAGLIHPETHFTDEKAGQLRAATYLRLRRHWQFVNELKLFEIDNHVSYGVHVYGTTQQDPNFLMASSLYHPDTVARSLKHDGSGPEPGMKDPDGNWDLRPHASRIVEVKQETLIAWHALLADSGTPVAQSRMVYTVNRSVSAVLNKLAAAPRLGNISLRHTLGWNETSARKEGRFQKNWGTVTSWDDVILQGPHIFVARPMFKTPNATLLHNRDWSTIDLESISADFIPATAYSPTGESSDYNEGFPKWTIDQKQISTRNFFRIVWRSMAASTNERTLIPCVIPPGTAFVTQSIYAAGLPTKSLHELVTISGWLSSLLCDFIVRSSPKSSIPRSIVDRLPYPDNFILERDISIRALRLNSVTNAYSELWAEALTNGVTQSPWVPSYVSPAGTLLENVGEDWSWESPLRRDIDRRQALVEIDAIVAVSLAISADELCSIYRTQFPVLFGYDRNSYFYDAHGRLVPKEVLNAWRTKGERVTVEERTATNPSGAPYIYELPFLTMDRENDMRVAHAHFTQLLKDRS
jgi:hypothetical protein